MANNKRDRRKPQKANKKTGELSRHKAQLTVDAIERKMKWDMLTNSQKVKYLDNKFGEGLGASKQRAKLLKLMYEEKELQN